MYQRNTRKINSFLNRLGVMQGRLVLQETNKIQSFPWKNWKKEFKICLRNNLHFIEWTIDNYNFLKNPINKPGGSEEINLLKKKYKTKIISLTADFFMQKPFFQENLKKKINSEFNKLKTIIINSNKIGVKYIILPLVDNSSLKNSKKIKSFIKKISELKTELKKNKQMILFESDLKPNKLHKFIRKFEKKYFGINYDTGNSASQGYKFDQEKKYFDYVKNIHIKDRILNGTTVRLGRGNFDFKKFFKFILHSKYKGNFIFQTARKRYRDIEEININKNYLIDNLR